MFIYISLAHSFLLHMPMSVVYRKLDIHVQWATLVLTIAVVGGGLGMSNEKATPSGSNAIVR